MGLLRWLFGSRAVRTPPPRVAAPRRAGSVSVEVTGDPSSQHGGPIQLTFSGPNENVRPRLPRLQRWPAPPSPATVAGRPCFPIEPGQWFGFDIVGESHYLTTLRRIASGRLSEEAQERAEDHLREQSDGDFESDSRVFVRCLVIPEPNNPHDRNAIRVDVLGHGTVGYFCREDAIRYRGLAKKLLEAGQIGTCEGHLMGGWDDDTNIGVRLSIVGPEEFRDAPDPTALSDLKRLAVSRSSWAPTIVAEGWEAWRRVPLGPGRGGHKFNITAEKLCATVVDELDGGRTAKYDPVVFDCTLVPQLGPAYGDASRKEPQIIVHADGCGVVGAFTAGCVEKYEELFLYLLNAPAVGACQGILFPEDDPFLGVKLSIKGPKLVMKGIA